MTSSQNQPRDIDDSLYKLLVDTYPELILVAEDDGTIVYMNRVAPGYTLEEVLGTNMRDHVAPEHLPMQEKAMAQARESGEQVVYEIRVDTEGAPRWFGTRLRHVRADRPYFFAYTSEVTDSRRSEMALSNAQRMESIGQLAGGVAHDFNNLLTTIITFTRLVRDEMSETDPRRADLTEVLKASDMAAKLTNQLLSLARKRPITAVDMEVNEAIMNVTQMLSRTLGSAIDIDFQPSDRPAFIKFDCAQFDQLIFNLAINAKDAMDGAGKITISVDLDSEPNKVLLGVSDTGCGMDEDVAQRIFEPFFTTKGEKGTGLGLATSYSIVKQFGGDVHVHSAPGKGATFHCELPIASQDAVAGKAPNKETKGKKGKNAHRPLRVVVVEDQAAIRRMIVRTLQRAGYETFDYGRAETALESIESEQVIPDVVLSDVILEGMDGIAFREKLRTLMPHVPFVLTSGYPGGTQASQKVEDESTRFLKKPFAPNQLVGCVQEVVGRQGVRNDSTNA